MAKVNSGQFNPERIDTMIHELDRRIQIIQESLDTIERSIQDARIAKNELVELIYTYQPMNTRKITKYLDGMTHEMDILSKMTMDSEIAQLERTKRRLEELRAYYYGTYMPSVERQRGDDA